MNHRKVTDYSKDEKVPLWMETMMADDGAPLGKPEGCEPNPLGIER